MYTKYHLKSDTVEFNPLGDLTQNNPEKERRGTEGQRDRETSRKREGQGDRER